MYIHERALLVPLNEKGINDFDHGIEDSKDCVCVDFPEKQYNAVKQVLSGFSDEHHLMIDDYESAECDYKIFEDNIDVFESVKGDAPVLWDMINKSIGCKTFVSFIF